MFDSNSASGKLELDETRSNLPPDKAVYGESVSDPSRNFPKTTTKPTVVLRKVKSEEALQTPKAKVTIIKDKVNPHGDAIDKTGRATSAISYRGLY